MSERFGRRRSNRSVRPWIPAAIATSSIVTVALLMLAGLHIVMEEAPASTDPSALGLIRSIWDRYLLPTVVLTVFVAAGVGLAIWRLSRPIQSVRSHDHRAMPAGRDAYSGGALPKMEDDRATLIDVCVELYVVGNPAVRERLADGLAAAGVARLEPRQGDRFDTRVHEAVGSVAAVEGASGGQIASVEEPGFVDRDRVVRRAEVIVYREDAG